MSDLDDSLCSIEAAIRVDPARRGLLSNAAETPLGIGQLAAAAGDLVERGHNVAIVTGFAIPTAAGPLPETDGPPGAVLLADVCRRLGMRVRLVTDELAHNAVTVAARQIGMQAEDVACCPLDRAAAQRWCDDFLSRSPDLTHLIAIERPGPNHTAESILATAGPAACEEYCALVAPGDRDCCHNMRGENIDRHTAPLHRLFEGVDVRRYAGAKERTGGWGRSEAQPPAGPHTIGIGDGGNEIGMGWFPWATLHPLIAGGQGKRIACRIATDWAILSGTSNWGGFALGAVVALLQRRPDLIETWTAERHRTVLETLVEQGPAVDGVTRERTATVDGLPFLTYIQPWERIRAAAIRSP